MRCNSARGSVEFSSALTRESGGRALLLQPPSKMFCADYRSAAGKVDEPTKERSQKVTGNSMVQSMIAGHQTPAPDHINSGMIRKREDATEPARN